MLIQSLKTSGLCSEPALSSALLVSHALSYHQLSQISNLSGTLLSQKFEVNFRDSNASKKQSNDGEADVKSGKKLQ